MSGLSAACAEKAKTPLPAKYLTFHADDILGEKFWKDMHLTIELAREFGVEHGRAYDYLRQIELEHGPAVAKEVTNWFDRLTGRAKLGKTESQQATERVLQKAGEYQILKLSPLTSAQNFYQRFLTAMEWGATPTVKGWLKSYGRKSRIKARRSGAIPFDPFQSGVAADLRTGEGQAFARAWIEGIGMGITERGNNYTAATIAIENIQKDLAKLAGKKSKLGQFARSLLSLGGDSHSAIKRRLGRHGINWRKAVKRGHLTLEEVQIAALREAKSKHFRSDLFTTPLWWQSSPWARQWAKYKVPFAYNMMTKIWKLSVEELKKGNLRPAIAFLIVTAIAGEIYHGIRSVLFGEKREDVSIARRLWQNVREGGAVALFTSFVFGKDIVEGLWNFFGGVWGKTAQNVKRTVQNIIDAPEHKYDHVLQLVEREIPAYKYLKNTVKRKEHTSKYQRQKIKYDIEDEFTKKEGDLYFYYNDLYSALDNKDSKKAKAAVKSIARLGGDIDSIMSAMEARRPSKTSLEKRPLMLREAKSAEIKIIADIILSTYILKIIVAAIDTPFIYLSKAIVRKRPTLVG